MVNEIEKNTFGTIEIKYTRPKFVHRILACLLDLIIFAICFIGLFSLTRYIVSTTPKYTKTFNDLTALKLESGLYKDRDGSTVDVVSYINSQSGYNDTNKVKICEQSIAMFLEFEDKYNTLEQCLKINTEYDTKRLEKITDGGVHYFVVQDDEIVKNSDLFASSIYLYRDFYINYIDTYFQGYLSTTPNYYDLTKILSNYLIWVEVPIAYIISVIAVYYVPTLFFKRNRQTLGKAMYRIGCVDSKFLSVKFGRNTAKWGIFLLEMILGVFSFGIIFICSFSLMAFSKNKQGFPDYMLGIQEVDLSNNKIYHSYVEIELAKATTYKKPTDFKLIDTP